MTMWNRIALSGNLRPHRSLSLVLPAFLVVLALVLLMPSPALSTRVLAKHGRIPGTVVPCYHQKAQRFTAEIEPNGCELAGTKGQKRKPTKLLIVGMKWNRWGTFSSQGAYGVEVRTGLPVRVIVFRRVECPDGRIWYSSAVVFKTENGHISVLRLKPCALSDPHG
jgi:hypothetical protein